MSIFGFSGGVAGDEDRGGTVEVISMCRGGLYMWEVQKRAVMGD